MLYYFCFVYHLTHMNVQSGVEHVDKVDNLLGH